jgi:hypothetical protein
VSRLPRARGCGGSSPRLVTARLRAGYALADVDPHLEAAAYLVRHHQGISVPIQNVVDIAGVGEAESTL